MPSHINTQKLDKIRLSKDNIVESMKQFQILIGDIIKRLCLYFCTINLLNKWVGGGQIVVIFQIDYETRCKLEK